ncbi:MAG TPA: patatin-like phospholipase family protein [Mycobacterium sp.]|nr:patatin-like phospholipase family protein [Mycobacterium sp.]
MAERLALVLAGGGVAGIAWETGFLLGVQDSEPEAAGHLIDPDVLLGTSAGSAVAAQISSGVPLAELYARQLVENTHEILPRLEIPELIELFEHVADADSSMTEKLQAIGKQALSAPTVSEEARRTVIAKRLPSHDWPARPLAVTAIDVESGERVLFDRTSGVSLVDAVAASCAVPLVWPPVTIDGRRFMDGGIGSSANVGMVRDADAVVMLAPTPAPGLSPFGRSLTDELAEFPGCTAGFFADDASVAAFGRNPLDPASRAASAAAGRAQGRRQAREVAEFIVRTLT